MSLLVRLKEGHTVEVIRRHADAFTSATGVDVEIDVVPESRAHDDLFAARPDVVTVPFWYLDELVARNALRPVGQLVGEDWLRESRFAPQSLAALTRASERWAVPHTLTGGVLSYRADVFDELGLAAPSTTEDVLRAARIVRHARPAMAGLVARANREFSSLETYAGWAWSDGVKILPDVGEPDLDVVRAGAGKLIRTLGQCGPADLVQRSYAQVGDLVLQGGAAQLFDTSAWGYFLENVGASSVAGRMAYTTVRGSVRPAQFLYAEGLGVTSWSAKAPEAAAFIQWRHSASVLEREVRMLGRIDLPRLDLWDMDWYQEHLACRGLATYMEVVRSAWAEVDTGHVARRPDFVKRARALMDFIAPMVTTFYDEADEAVE